jgi:tRNA/tmRNA/rRNA uracil-C5-methylase (TrmA/RlmC/RlmD family)
MTVIGVYIGSGKRIDEICIGCKWEEKNVERQIKIKGKEIRDKKREKGGNSSPQKRATSVIKINIQYL